MHHAASHALQRSSASSTSFLWISDSLLAESIQRFGRLHLRHGSSVPGPLESRRRATKRKNTSLASAGHWTPPNEAGILFGHGQDAGWWKPSTENATEQRSVEAPLATILPSWFSQNLLSLAESPPETVPARDAHQEFHFQLPTCQTLQHIRDLIRRLDIDLSQTPAYSREILLHLLSDVGEFGEIHEFMLDARLHTPGSSCLDGLMSWCGVHPLTSDQLASLHACLRKTLGLGLVQNQEVQMLWANLSNIKIQEQAAISQLSDKEIIHDWYWMMADAMRKCPVFGLKDVGESELRQWSSCLVAAPFSAVSLRTFGILRCYLSKIGEDFASSIAEQLIAKWIAAQEKPVHGPSVPQKYGLQEVSSDCLKMSTFLQDLKPGAAALAIYRTTERIVTDSAAHGPQGDDLELWRQVLSTIPGSSAGTIVRQPGWKHFAGYRDDASVLSLRQGICARLWTAMGIVPKALESHLSWWAQDLIKHLVRCFKRQLKPDEDLLAQLILTFLSLPFKSRSTVIERVVRLSTLYFHIEADIGKLEAGLLDSSKGRVSLFTDDSMYRHATMSMKSHLTQLAERTNTDAEAFLHMAHALIMRDKMSVKIVTRILENNLALSLSLAYSTSQPKQQQDRSTQARTIPTAVSAQEALPEPLTPGLALQIFTCLARSFAISPVLTPRQAFRKVYWVHQHLCSHTAGRGIGPEIVRALWYAGVAREHQRGTSREKLDWILSKVAQVEGQDVADRLLWSGSRSLKSIGWEHWADIDVNRELHQVQGYAGRPSGQGLSSRDQPSSTGAVIRRHTQEKRKRVEKVVRR